jgi:tetratricopeptide (TPR) repeat protein
MTRAHHDLEARRRRRGRAASLGAALAGAALAALTALVVVAPGRAEPAAGREGADATGTVPLFDGLGGFTRKVTTSSPEAQSYFDQGLAFMYAFNHDEAIRSFRRAAELDPQCAMAQWGVAIANGPHINNPVVPLERARAAFAAVTAAKALEAGASPVERALIRAAEARYADPPPEDRKALEQAYADAMRGVWKQFPDDGDVGALFAEALADLRPWDLWTEDGRPQPGTEELLSTLETVIARHPRHPLALHLYIHSVEASPHPEKADAAADALRGLQPGLGHLVHMPSHVDVRRGRWAEAVTANEKAIEADRVYRERSPDQGFYRLYMAHNHHMLAYGAMMGGRSRLALDTIRAMAQGIPLEFVKDNPWADGFLAMPLEVMMRFGKWDDILAAPDFPEFAPVSRALRFYARAVARAAKADVPGAKAEQASFAEARTRVPKDAIFGNNTASDILDVAESLVKGEILYRDGRVDEGLAALREAVGREDELRYDEPPDWIQPVRHALGAALLGAGRFDEAEAVFREDLRRLPENGWGLYGLHRALQMQRKEAASAEVEKRFDHVWREADLTIKSPCLCLPGV